jgi:hypothetical protein
MQTGGALTTWTLMVMNAGVKWTGEQKEIEGFCKNERINDTALHITQILSKNRLVIHQDMFL